MGQLVDLPDCLHYPTCGFPRTAGTGGTGRARHPVRLLLFGYHLEVRCGAPDLPDYLRQVAAREGWHASRLSDGLGPLLGSRLLPVFHINFRLVPLYMSITLFAAA